MTRRVLTLALLSGLALGCKPKPGPTAPPTPETPDPRAKDAAALRDFDVSADTPISPTGVPYERYHVTVGDAPVRGPEDAPVTIVMYSDFECPFCLRAHKTMKELERRYGGQIRIVYKAFPLDFHENAFVAAMAARSAQKQGKFWAFHDQLYSQQGLERDRLLAYAKEAGLNVKLLKKQLETLEFAPAVSRDMRQGRRLGVHSTPSFFVNGRLIKGAQPTDMIAQMIEQEIDLANKWVEEGVAPGEIYEHAIADGYRRVAYTKQRGLDPDGVYPVVIGDPTRGPDDALVTIVEFGDFECPFCARGHEVLEKIRDRYKGQIRFVFKHQPLPFHSHAFLAARASMAAHAQDKFWAFHDALYDKQAQFDEGDLKAVARKVGLNMKAFNQALDSTRHDAAITADQQLAAALGVRGTPAYFVNGRPIEGAQPELAFRIIVEEELGRARAALEDGVKQDALYDHLIRQELD